MESIKPPRREWNELDGRWWSNDDVQIDGRPGHWFPTLCDSSLTECETPEKAMALADEQWPLRGTRG
jgi:hypothetical protein